MLLPAALGRSTEEQSGLDHDRAVTMGLPWQSLADCHGHSVQTHRIGPSAASAGLLWGQPTQVKLGLPLVTWPQPQSGGGPPGSTAGKLTLMGLAGNAPLFLSFLACVTREDLKLCWPAGSGSPTRARTGKGAGNGAGGAGSPGKPGRGRGTSSRNMGAGPFLLLPPQASVAFNWGMPGGRAAHATVTWESRFQTWGDRAGLPQASWLSPCVQMGAKGSGPAQGMAELGLCHRARQQEMLPGEWRTECPEMGAGGSQCPPSSLPPALPSSWGPASSPPHPQTPGGAARPRQTPSLESSQVGRDTARAICSDACILLTLGPLRPTQLPPGRLLLANPSLSAAHLLALPPWALIMTPASTSASWV